MSFQHKAVGATAFFSKPARTGTGRDLILKQCLPENQQNLTSLFLCLREHLLLRKNTPITKLCSLGKQSPFHLLNKIFILKVRGNTIALKYLRHSMCWKTLQHVSKALCGLYSRPSIGAVDKFTHSASHHFSQVGKYKHCEAKKGHYWFWPWIF